MAITGLGMVTPFGHGSEAVLDGLARGQSSVRSVELDGLDGQRLCAALVPVSPSLPVVAGGDRSSQFLVAAAKEALENSGAPRGRMGWFVGTCSGAMRDFELWTGGGAGSRDAGRWYQAPGERARDALTPGAPVLTFTSACTSSLAALHAAVRALRRGELDTAIVAGTDATSAFAASGFVALKAASETPSRPFARVRSGLSFGEGAAALVLEREARAPLGYVQGTALSCDARHVTAPRVDGLGLELAIAGAARDAGVDLGEVEVYASHGTGTVANDAMELLVARRLGLLGKPWLAHKGFIGHAMGASGLLSLALALLQARAGADFSVPYSDWEDGVVLAGSLRGVRRGLVAAAAFGGSNGAALWEVA